MNPRSENGRSTPPTRLPRTHAANALARTAAAALALAFALSGCAGGASRPSPPVETRDAGGFTLTETTRIPASARSQFDAASAALAAGDLDRAIETLRALVADSPALTAAQVNLGIALARRGDLAPAEQAFLAALALSPTHPVAQNELGIAYRRMGKFPEARKQFEAALAAHPEFHFARKNLAILCDLYLSDPACALEHYEHYRAANPGDEKVEMWLADLRNRVGQ